MTLDEAIRYAEEVAEYDCYNDGQRRCAEEHRQLAEWLKMLKRLKAPHGRLIDADALVDTVYYTNISESVKEFIADLIEIAPTVIEAEEG